MAYEQQRRANKWSRSVTVSARDFRMPLDVFRHVVLPREGLIAALNRAQERSPTAGIQVSLSVDGAPSRLGTQKLCRCGAARVCGECDRWYLTVSACTLLELVGTYLRSHARTKVASQTLHLATVLLLGWSAVLETVQGPVDGEVGDWDRSLAALGSYWMSFGSVAGGCSEVFDGSVGSGSCIGNSGTSISSKMICGVAGTDGGGNFAMMKGP
jgi:hypothetical protein